MQAIPVNKKVTESYFEGMYVYQATIEDSAPTLVFLHDSLGCTQLWRDFPSQLATAANFNILIYDRIGYGKAAPMKTWKRPSDYMSLEAAKLLHLLDHYAIKNPILFGHSDGGTIALLAAAKAPKTIGAVIVEAAHIFVEPITIAGIKAAEHSYNTSNLPNRLAKYHGAKVDFLFNAWTKTWTSSAFQDWNIEEELKNITSPLLFIQGRADEYGSLDQVNQTLKNVNGPTQQSILEGIGHTPHKEVPEQVLALSLAFLKTHLN